MYQAILRLFAECTSHHDRAKQPHRLLMILGISVLLVLFRFHIFAILGLKEIGRIVVVIPLLAAVVGVLSVHRRGKLNILSAWPFLAALVMLASAIFLITDGDVTADTVRSIFIHKITALVFLSAIVAIGFDTKSYISVLKMLATYILFIGGGLAILESLLYRFFIVDQLQFVSFFMPTTGHTNGWDVESLVLQHMRVIGFCFGTHESAFAVLAAWVFLMESTFQTNLSKGISALITFWAIIESGAFTVLGVLFLYCCFYLSKYDVSHYRSQIKKILPVLILGVTLLFITVLKSPLLDRFEFYNLHWSLYSSELIPTFSECHAIRMVGAAPAGANCDVPEVKFLAPAFHFGFLTHLPYFIFVLIPFFRLIYGPSLRDDEKAIFITYLILIASLVHYNAIEKWGQNYFFFILVAALISPWALGGTSQDNKFS